MSDNNISAMENEIQEIAVDKETHISSSADVKSKITTIGGQALIEGLMMVGPRRIAIAVRKSDGSIVVEEIAQGNKMIFFERVPFIRGGLRLFRQLITGTGALMKSAELSEEPAPVALSPLVGEAVPNAEEAPKPKEKVSRMDSFLEKHMNIVVIFSAILGILFSVVLFILLPRAIVDLGTFWLTDSQRSLFSVILIKNLVEGLLRITIFIGYLALTSRIKDIARVWMYHGSEHKTIACYEAGEELTVANIRKYSRFHPRCGTAFLFLVVIVSILVFSIVGVFLRVDIWWVNSLIRLALVPFVAGIAYEIIRFTGRHGNNALCRSVSKPGMWMQRFTTREPDDSMIEVAIAAMQAVLPENTSEDNW